MRVSLRLAALVLLLTGMRPAQGYDVLVSVTGTLIGNTCVVAADSLVKNLPLGTIGIKQFSRAGAVSNIKTPFTLKLEECGPTFAGVRITCLLYTSPSPRDCS